MDRETAGLLHMFGHVYLRQGQSRRAAVLLMLAARGRPDDPALLRGLAAALTACGLGGRAAEVLDRADALDPAGAAQPMAGVLRARALLADGRREEARRVFREATASRRGREAA
jgi:type III secretion protein Y